MSEPPVRTEREKTLRARRQLKLVERALWTAMILLGVGVILLVPVSVVAIRAYQNTKTNQDRIEHEARQSAWLTCRYVQLNSTELHVSAIKVGGPRLLANRRQREPIRDCGPALKGLVPVSLSDAEQTRYETFFASMNTPPQIQGGHVLEVPDRAAPYTKTTTAGR